MTDYTLFTQGRQVRKGGIMRSTVRSNGILLK